MKEWDFGDVDLDEFWGVEKEQDDGFFHKDEFRSMIDHYAFGDELHEDLLRGSAILGQESHDMVMHSRRLLINLIGYVTAQSIPPDMSDEDIALRARAVVQAALHLRNSIRHEFLTAEADTDDTMH